MLKRTRMFIAGSIAALALPASAGADPGPYVALGDSYTAAPLVLNQSGRPAGCSRSDHNYPSLVAAWSGVGDFTDVSCAGAQTRDMSAPQTVSFGFNAPQFDALRDGTRLVTVGIGGNDAGLVGAAVKCAGLGVTAPGGSACRSYFSPGGVDGFPAKFARTAPKIAALLAAIHERSPQARIALVGYPDVAPRTGNGCYPLVPLSADDLRYFDSLIVRLNAMLAEQAAANGAEYVDTYTDSIGHDVCSLPGGKWFEALVPTAVAYPLHPNALGMQSMARSVVRVLSAPRPAPVLSRLERAHRTIARGRTARLSYRLDRAATVAVVLRRATPRRRYVVVRRMTAQGSFGDNALAVGAKAYARRAGLYSVEATPAGGVAQVVRFRVRR
jgi:lysophospholipase L1-like esterase